MQSRNQDQIMDELMTSY